MGRGMHHHRCEDGFEDGSHLDVTMGFQWHENGGFKHQQHQLLFGISPMNDDMDMGVETWDMPQYGNYLQVKKR